MCTYVIFLYYDFIVIFLAPLWHPEPFLFVSLSNKGNQKDIKGNKMAKVISRSTDNPKIGQKVLSDGRLSLYLEYYLGYSMVYSETKGCDVPKKHRKKESLNLYLLSTPRTPSERQKNKEILELAKEIRAEREQQLKADKTGKRINANLKKINLFDFMDNYTESYTKKDIRVIACVIDHFKKFMAQKYPIHRTTLKPDQLSKEMVKGFVDYLTDYCKGDGAKSYYQRFKKVINAAIDQDIIAKNPCKGIVCKGDDQALRKDILSIEEVEQLIATTYTGQNPNVRRAFIFCLYTGLRFCDVSQLQYKNVDYTNRLLSFEQAKTKGHSASSGVVIPLNDGLISLVSTPPEEGGKEALIFELPSSTMCLKALRHWTARAGIDKHITWHCARHSFAVNILNNGANIKTVASLLGHSGLKHTEKYTRAVDSLKEAAINSLPELKL